MCITVIDPKGNEVSIPKKLLPADLLSGRNKAVYDPPEKVIERPAILLTTCKEAAAAPTETCENHYFRSIGWQDTLLISARKKEGRWTAYQCICNPSFQQLSHLFKVAKQLSFLYLSNMLATGLLPSLVA